MSTEKRQNSPEAERDRQERRKAVIDEVDRDTELGAPMAPQQNREPSEQHRGGPLPNQKK